MSATELDSKPQVLRRPYVSRRWLIIVMVALLLSAGLITKGWLIYGKAQAVRADARALQGLAQGPFDRAAAERLGPLLAQTRTDTSALRAEAALLLPITPYLGWVPRYGGELAASGPLLDASVELSAAADDAFTVFGPLLAPADSAPLTGPRLQAQLDAERLAYEHARTSLARAADTWAQIDMATLSPATARQLQPIDQSLPFGRLALEVAPALPALLDDLQALQPYTAGQPSATQLAALGPLLTKTRADTAALRTAAAPLLGASARLADTAPLLESAADLAAAADDAYAGLAPLLLSRGSAETLGAALLSQVQAAQPQLQAARDAATRAADAAARLQVAQIPAPLATRLQPLAALAGLLRDSMTLALALPDLLGAHAPAEYLLLAQNPDELRATGGFIGAAGTVAFSGGRPNEVVLRYSPDIDDYANVVYPDPPQPQLRYMNIEMWLFRDANWSPDFPTTAKQARDLYALGQGHAPANVVAFDPYFAQMLLEVLGPVNVEGSTTPVSSQNVLTYLRSEHDEQKGQQNPKAYIGRLANAMLAKVNNTGAHLDAWRLALALRRALYERHLLLDVPNPQAQALFARYGWNGAVQPGTTDFLMPVDTNMGYNKVNANVTTAISYVLDLSEPSAPQAVLTLRHHNAAQSHDTCTQFRDDKNSYADWMQRCFYDYMRVLVPHGSEFIGANTLPVPDAWMESGVGDDGTVHVAEGAGGTTELSVFQVISFGETRDTVLRYKLPTTIVTRDAQGWHYRLRIQKQPGTLATSFSVSIKLPVGASVLHASPALATTGRQQAQFVGKLTSDILIDINF